MSEDMNKEWEAPFTKEIDQHCYNYIQECMAMTQDELFYAGRTARQVMDNSLAMEFIKHGYSFEQNRSFGLKANRTAQIAELMYEVWAEFKRNKIDRINPVDFEREDIAVKAFRNSSVVERANLYAMTVGDTSFLERIYRWLYRTGQKVMRE